MPSEDGKASFYPVFFSYHTHWFLLTIKAVLYGQLRCGDVTVKKYASLKRFQQARSDRIVGRALPCLRPTWAQSLGSHIIPWSLPGVLPDLWPERRTTRKPGKLLSMSPKSNQRKGSSICEQVGVGSFSNILGKLGLIILPLLPSNHPALLGNYSVCAANPGDDESFSPSKFGMTSVQEYVYHFPFQKKHCSEE